ncbi:hypothetical protein N6H05_23765 [Sphingobium sp. WTD-1]|uniref:DUF6680 family protein n=1 Tax=Sphingobium sp. WTD-1 TaxID=2979467 RepID=UPI0024DEA78D|nr:DUF6680 family protein [Sphingobium sp. WTD-1]WIA55997.1 hypothetical protein N6H05_23765 [Sphingobium sp. WTD-1]
MGDTCLITSAWNGAISFGHWIGTIPDGDKLGAIVNGLSIIAAILVAGWISPKLQDRASKQDRKERTLRILLNTWQTPANPEYQSALAMTALDFHDVKPVMKARADYLAQVNGPPPEEDVDAATAHFQKAQSLQIAIMCAMADDLDYDISPESLRSGAYVSKGFVDREVMVLKAMEAWPQIAGSLRESNMIVLGIHPLQQPQQGDDKDNSVKD